MYAPREAARVAGRLLRAFDSLDAVLAAPDLAAVPGVGPRAVALLRSHARLRAWGERARLRRALTFATTAAVGEHLAASGVVGSPTEVFRALYLDPRNALIDDVEVARGTVNSVAVYPREIARRALLCHATAVVLAHNHPSGRAEPSPEDIQLTWLVERALQPLGIALHDHLVLGGGRVFSFRGAGMLDGGAPGRG